MVAMGGAEMLFSIWDSSGLERPVAPETSLRVRPRFNRNWRTRCPMFNAEISFRTSMGTGTIGASIRNCCSEHYRISSTSSPTRHDIIQGRQCVRGVRKGRTQRIESRRNASFGRFPKKPCAPRRVSGENSRCWRNALHRGLGPQRNTTSADGGRFLPAEEK